MSPRAVASGSTVWIGYEAAPFGRAVADPEEGYALALREKAGLVLVSLAMASDRLTNLLRGLGELPLDRRCVVVGVGVEAPVAGRGNLDVVVDSPAQAAACREVLLHRAWEPGPGAVDPLIGSSTLTVMGNDLTSLLRTLERAVGAESAVAWTASSIATSGRALDACSMSALERAGALGAPVLAHGRTYAGGGDRSRHDGVLVGVSWSRPRLVGRRVSGLLHDLADRVGRELALSRTLASNNGELVRARGNRLLDPRTGILSREATVLVGNSVASALRRAGRSLCVAVVDVVGLRHVNARYGHRTGDAVLVQLAETVSRMLRRQDSLGVLDEDAIAVILPDLPLADAEPHLARLFSLVARAPAHDGSAEVAYAIQIGLTALGPEERVEAALSRAAALANRRGIISVSDRSDAPVPGPARCDVEPGDILGGRYRVLHRLGGGLLSEVFRAVDTSLDRPVAIRILHPESTGDRDDLERFLDRLRSICAVQHRALCEIISIGTVADRPFVVMELIDGASLAERAQAAALRNARLPAAQVVSTLEPIAAALDHLHARGVAHTDVRAATVVRDPFDARAVLLPPAPRLHGDAELRALGDPARAMADDLVDFAATALSALTSIMPLDARPSGAPSPAPWIASGPYVELGGDAATSAVFDRAFGLPEGRYANATALVAALRATLLEHERDEAEPDRAPSVGATRGLVFRAFGWVLGAAAPGSSPLGPELRDALSWEAPALAWFPRQHFEDLVRWIDHAEGASSLSRRAAHALVRTSFRRFFPASALTLTPVRVLQSLPLVWRRYHSWGRIEATLVGSGEARVHLGDAPTSAAAREWVAGLIEQLVALSGGSGCSSTPDVGSGVDLLVRVRWSNDAQGDLRAVIGDLSTRDAR